jgi:hypothetical protein
MLTKSDLYIDALAAHTTHQGSTDWLPDWTCARAQESWGLPTHLYVSASWLRFVSPVFTAKLDNNYAIVFLPRRANEVNVFMYDRRADFTPRPSIYCTKSNAYVFLGKLPLNLSEPTTLTSLINTDTEATLNLHTDQVPQDVTFTFGAKSIHIRMDV